MRNISDFFVLHQANRLIVNEESLSGLLRLIVPTVFYLLLCLVLFGTLLSFICHFSLFLVLMFFLFF